MKNVVATGSCQMQMFAGPAAEKQKVEKKESENQIRITQVQTPANHFQESMTMPN